MKITIGRLKEIIKEEISDAEPVPSGDDKLDKYTSGAAQKVRSVLDRQNVASGLGDIAKELLKYEKDIAMQSKIVGEMMAKIGIGPAGLYKVAMHLKPKEGEKSEL